jgi:hypothetical protein
MIHQPSILLGERCRSFLWGSGFDTGLSTLSFSSEKGGTRSLSFRYLFSAIDAAGI